MSTKAYTNKQKGGDKITYEPKKGLETESGADAVRGTPTSSVQSVRTKNTLADTKNTLADKRADGGGTRKRTLKTVKVEEEGVACDVGLGVSPRSGRGVHKRSRRSATPEQA